MDFSNKADYAKRLFRDMGYNLIPVHGKNPPCVPWKPWTTERVSVEQFTEWANSRWFKTRSGRFWHLPFPTILNWAIPTGLKPYSESPAIVAETLVAIRCPVTQAMQRTPGGGWHRVYLRPAQPAYIPIRQGTVIEGKKYKIDIRADMGYFMAPGSICPKRGTRYQWTQPWTLEMFWSLPEYDLNWLPDERSTRTRQGKERNRESPPALCLDHDEAVELRGLLPLPLRIDAARRYLCSCPGAQQGKKADNYCFALSMTLCWGFAIPAQDAYDLLYAWGQKEDNLNDVGGYYPWSSAEVWHKIDNACHTEYEGHVGDRFDSMRCLEEQAERFMASLK